MPSYLKRLSLAGSMLLFLLFLLLAWVGPSHSTGMMVIGLGGMIIVAFNAYLLRKAARLLEEEEWLKAEVRKAELRQRLRALNGESAAVAGPVLAALPSPQDMAGRSIGSD